MSSPSLHPVESMDIVPIDDDPHLIDMLERQRDCRPNYIIYFDSDDSVTDSEEVSTTDSEESSQAKTNSFNDIPDSSSGDQPDFTPDLSQPSLLVKGPVRSNRFLRKCIDAIGLLKEFKNVDYNFYARNPQGLRTPESSYRWSLYKHDWFSVQTVKGVEALVSRSILEEMGIPVRGLGPPTDEDLEDAEGLPSYPIRLQDLHRTKCHSRKRCYWPKMTKNPAHIPVLDRSFDAYCLDVLVVHDPNNVTHLQPEPSELTSSDDDKSSNNPAATLLKRHPSDQSQESGDQTDCLARQSDVTINYIRVDPKVIGVPWVPLPPNGPPAVGHLHLSASARAGLGNSAAAWDAKLDLPYAIVHSLFHKCYRPSSHAFREYFREELDDLYEATETDLAGDPNEPDHRRNELPTRFRVIAKIAAIGARNQAFVNNEAKAYAGMPKTFGEQWSGYHLVNPIAVAQPASAIVPIIYGYYVPEVRYGKLSNGRPVSMADGRRLAPLLLMENCGTQIDVDMTTLHTNYKEQLFVMMTRLHMGGCTQGSVYQRNWLVQPGPLHVAPGKRSLKKPSFRMIDFGRAVCWNDKGKMFESATFADLGGINTLMNYRHWEDNRE